MFNELYIFQSNCRSLLEIKKEVFHDFVFVICTYYRPTECYSGTVKNDINLRKI